MYCNCDDEVDQPEFARTQMRIAKKPHRCCECRDTIRPGERYEIVTGVWSGEWETYKTCTECLDTRQRAWDMNGFIPPFGEAACCFMEGIRNAEW